MPPTPILPDSLDRRIADARDEWAFRQAQLADQYDQAAVVGLGAPSVHVLAELDLLARRAQRLYFDLLTLRKGVA